ncbi:MAG: metallophosphoesterase family protein [Desulfurococcales archaeon]|nr:metallophosphoesterase family protein [Desulfurococcales archaeon]
MRIFIVSDVHCSYQYSARAAYEVVRAGASVVVVAGDIECSDPLEELLSTGVRVFAVTGNLDDIYIYRLLKNYGVGIDGDAIEYNGYYFAGIGGIGYGSNLERVSKKLENITGDKLIVVSHYPARGFNDVTYSGYHAGLPELRDFIEKYNPIMYIHGHIHESRGVSKYRNTIIINPGPLMHGYYAIADIGREAGVKVELKRL